MRAFHSFLPSFVTSALVSVLAILGLPSNAQYTITDLGTLGGTLSTASAINQAGHITGYATDAAGHDRAFLWQNGQMTDLGSAAGYGQSHGAALNSHDAVAGNITGTPSPTSKFHGALFQGGGITDIGSLIAPPSSFSQSDAFGINDNGQVVGNSEAVVNGSYGTHAVLWDSVNGLQDLTPGDHGSALYQARAINNAGQIVGSLAGNAFLYFNGALTDLTVATGVTFNPNKINDLAQIVGGQTTHIVGGMFPSIDYGHAVVYQNSQAQVLGTLPGFGGSTLTGLNNVGQSVGSAFNYSGTGTITAQDAILCYQSHLIDLNALLPNGSGWHLTTATDINDNGQIVGEGTVNGQTHGFLLTPAALTVGLSPQSVLGGQNATGFILLGSMAPAGGVVVALASNSSTVASVPTTVTVAVGSNTATFAVVTNAVGADTAVGLSATLSGETKTASLTVQTPMVLSLSVPISVRGGDSATGSVTVSGPAPTGGLTVALSSSKPGLVSVPVGVTVAAGATKATFTFTTSATATVTPVVLTATRGAAVTANLDVRPPDITSFNITPLRAPGGQNRTGTVVISTGAPAGGLVLAISNDNTALVSNPASVMFAAGATTASFLITTKAVSANTSVNVYMSFNNSSTGTNLILTPPDLSSVTVAPVRVKGGLNSIGTVTISDPAATGGAVVTLSSDNAASTVPASVTVPSGAKTATFTVTTRAVAVDAVTTLTAAFNSQTRTGTLTVQAPLVASIAVNPGTVKSLSSATLTLTLDSPAPTGGISVSLASSNTVAATVPASVTVAAGSTTVTAAVKTSFVSTDAHLTLSATLGTTSPSVAFTVVARLPFDFDYDGHNDLILQNQATNLVVVWFTSVLDILGGSSVSYLPPAGWQVVGCADFNHDGNPDLVLQNQTTGKIVVWYMAGTTVGGGEEISFQPGPGYKVVGIGDFNGDGKPDILFQQSGTGQLVIWFLNGATVTGGVSVPQVPVGGYNVVGVGDFNNDGKPDIIFQNQSNNQVVVWYMNGSQFAGGGAITYVPPFGWQVHAVEDLNGDGKPDLIFQNQTTNQLLVWFMDGLTIPGGGLMSLVPTPDYKLMAPH